MTQETISSTPRPWRLDGALRGELHRGRWQIAALALLVLATAWVMDGTAAFVAAQAPLAVGAAAAAVVDARTHRIPRQLVHWAALLGVGALLVLAAVLGTWNDLGRAVLGGVVAGFCYFAAVLIYPAGLGAGDARLVALFGLYAGWLGWGSVLGVMALPFLLAVPVALARLARGRRGDLALGPYFLASYLVVLVAHSVG